MTTEFFQYFNTIKMTVEFFKSEMTTWNSCEIHQGFDQNSFQELDDHGILMKFFKDCSQNLDNQKI